MPSAPARPCRQPGCPALVPGGGKCETHRSAEQARYNRARGSAHAQGYGRRWRKLRLLILARDPICKHCYRAPTTDVDHIIARKKGGDDSEENLQGLCGTCHSRKTALEDGRWGRGGSKV